MSEILLGSILYLTLEYRISQREYSSDNLPVQVVNFTYDELGNLISKEIKENTSTKQIINFDYNIRGWLTKINEPDTFATSGDYFAMKLYYEKELDQQVRSEPKNNGNISAIKWQTSSPKGVSDPESQGKKGFEFNYDNLNRLLSSGSFEEINGKLVHNSKYLESSPHYDRNGNIQYMARHGKNLSEGQETIDTLTYYYRGNQVIAVDDAIPYNNIIDFYDNGHSLLYGSRHPGILL